MSICLVLFLTHHLCKSGTCTWMLNRRRVGRRGGGGRRCHCLMCMSRLHQWIFGAFWWDCLWIVGFWICSPTPLVLRGESQLYQMDWIALTAYRWVGDVLSSRHSWIHYEFKNDPGKFENISVCMLDKWFSFFFPCEAWGCWPLWLLL